MSMYKLGSEKAAKKIATEQNRCYGYSVFSAGWFVGTHKELKKIGVDQPQKPSDLDVAAAKAIAASKRL